MGDKGNMSLSILSNEWAPSLNISKCLLTIQSILKDPDTENPMAPNIAKLYKTNKALHDINANEMAQKYANAPSKYSKDYVLQIKNAQKQRLENERMEKEKIDREFEEKYETIKNELIGLFGEISIFYLIIAFDGTYSDRLPKKMYEQFELDRIKYDKKQTMSDDICFEWKINKNKVQYE